MGIKFQLLSKLFLKINIFYIKYIILIIIFINISENKLEYIMLYSDYKLN